MSNYNIKEIEHSCYACPSQWEGILVDGRMFYIRYRCGFLSFKVSSTPTDDVYAAVVGENIYGEQIGEDLDGVISLRGVKEALEKKNIILRIEGDFFSDETPVKHLVLEDDS